MVKTLVISLIRRRLRLEFNQNRCDYYTEIDAVYLHGLDSKEEYSYDDDREDAVDSLNSIFEKQITVKNFRDEITNVEQDSWNILMLPVRIIMRYNIKGGGHQIKIYSSFIRRIDVYLKYLHSPL